MRKSPLLSYIACMAVYSAAAAGQAPPGSPTDQAIGLIQAATESRADGFYSRAEGQYRQSLAILETISGPRSADLTPALNGLAAVYFDERRYTDAESLTRRSASLAEARARAIREGRAPLPAGARNSGSGPRTQASLCGDNPRESRRTGARAGRLQPGGGALRPCRCDSGGSLWNRRSASGRDAGQLRGRAA